MPLLMMYSLESFRSLMRNCTLRFCDQFWIHGRYALSKSVCVSSAALSLSNLPSTSADRRVVKWPFLLASSCHLDSTCTASAVPLFSLDPNCVGPRGEVDVEFLSLCWSLARTILSRVLLTTLRRWMDLQLFGTV